jgi:trimeric autotransporter adhesin
LSWPHRVLTAKETAMGSWRSARLAGAAVAGLALAAAGLAGPAGAARAGAGVPPGGSVPGSISTVAGGVGGPGPATSVAIGPCGVRWADGSLYIGDGSTVRRVSTATGALTTVAGDNAAGPADASGAAVGSAISQACGTVLDRSGNLVIAAGSQVLVVPARTGTFYGRPMTAGHLYTIAGSAARSRDGGPAGDGGPATRAALSDAVDVALDRAGNLLIADSGDPSDCGEAIALGSLVRVVPARTGTFYGQKMKAGDIYTVAGVQSSHPAGNGGLATRASLGTTIGSVRPDRAGNLVVAATGENDPCSVIAPSVRVIADVTGTFYGMKMTAGHIYRVAGNGRAGSGGDGGRATAAALALAASAVVDGAGNLVIGDGSRVRVVAARTGRFYRQQMTAGHIYGIAGTGQGGYSGDGGPADRARLTAETVALDAAGDVLLAGGQRVQVVAARTGTFYGAKMTAGDIYTVAGNGTAFSGAGGPPLRAEFDNPTGIAADGAGDIAFTAVRDPDNGTSTTVDLIAAQSGTFFGRRLTAGNVYTLGGDGIDGFRGDNGPARNAQFSIGPGTSAVAFDSAGNLLVADQVNERVRLIAVTSGRFYGRAMTAGDVYTIAGSGGYGGFSGDGGPAVKAKLDYPTSAVPDGHGNVLIVDSSNARVRVVAATTGTFYGRKMTAGDIYTVAGDGGWSFSGDGGPAVKAGMLPLAVATDPAGNLIITDWNSRRVRLVAVRTGTMYGQKMTAGDIYTIAGSGEEGSSGSGGPAREAKFEILGGATADRYGNVIFTDTVGGALWVVAVKDGIFYGQAMTAGDIYLVAGGGATLGDGGPAARALLSSPSAVAVSPAGSLLVTDGGDNRLRAISP